MMCGNSLKGETDRYLSIISAQFHILKTLKNQKWGGPLEIGIFCWGGVNERGEKGVRSLLTPPPPFFYKRENVISKCVPR